MFYVLEIPVAYFKNDKKQIQTIAFFITFMDLSLNEYLNLITLWNSFFCVFIIFMPSKWKGIVYIFKVAKFLSYMSKCRYPFLDEKFSKDS